MSYREPKHEKPELAGEAYSRRHVLRGGLTVGVAVLASGSLAAACASGEGAPQSGAEQTWVVPQEWPALDTVRSNPGTNRGTLLLGLEPLLWLDADGSLVPNLAESRSMPDDRTYVYKLRKGVRFWDGSPLTTADVVASLKVHTGETQSRLAFDYGAVHSVRARGEDEVIVELSTPDSTFEQVIAGTGIFSAAYADKHGDKIGSPEVLNMGTGPYKFTSFRPGSQVVLERNESYWGTKSAVRRLTLRFIPDEAAQLLAAQSGDVTGIFEIPGSAEPIYSAISGSEVAKGPGFSLLFLTVPNGEPPFDDVHVRRALNHVVDRVGIVDSLLRGNGTPAPTVTTSAALRSVMPASEADELLRDLDYYPYDLDRARAELAKSAYPGGFTTEFIHSTAEPDYGRILQAIAAEARKIGIEIKVSGLPDQVYINRGLDKGNFAGIVSFTATRLDPLNIPLLLLYSKFKDVGFNDLALYENPEVDRMIENIRSLPVADEGTRAEAMKQLLRKVATDAPYVPIVYPTYTGLIDERLSFEQFDGFWHLTRWPTRVSKATP